MDISQVGLQSNVGMPHSAEQRSVTGSFAGMSVQVKENAADIRRYVRRLIEGVFYEIPVLDYQELTPEISVQPVDRIRI